MKLLRVISIFYFFLNGQNWNLLFMIKPVNQKYNNELLSG